MLSLLINGRTHSPINISHDGSRLASPVVCLLQSSGSPGNHPASTETAEGGLYSTSTLIKVHP